MGNRVTVASLFGAMLFAALAAFLFSPTAASASRGESHPGQFASGIIDAVTRRLCDRQQALFGRLSKPLIHPSRCAEEPPPPAEPTVDITADPMTITAGGSSELSWNSENADSCEASNGWSGDKAVDGSESISPAVTTTYTIECEGEGGTAEDSVTVTVNPVVPDEPTVDITADPLAITMGSSSTLTWNSDNADSCTASNGWSGSRPVDGTLVVSPAETTTYAIECVGDGGTAQDSVTVTVNPAEPETGTLVVRKVVIRDDGGTSATTTFTFQVNGGAATAFEADGENSMTVDVGTYSVSEPAVTGWTTTLDNCTSVAVADGETETCTITNNDVADEPDTGTLVVRKVVINDDGGSTATTSFSFQVDGGGAVAFEGDAENSVTVNVGVHSVVEVAADGYTTTYQNCVSVDVAAEETEICTITNNDNEQQSEIDHLLISVVYYDVNSTTTAEGRGTEPGNEWVELYNPTNAPVDLTNWWLSNATTSPDLDKIPAGTIIPAGGFLVITASSTTSSFWGNVPMLNLGNSIGGGLSNGGDAIALLNANGATTTVDAVSWGTNKAAFDPPVTGLVADNSLFRTSLLVDTDTAADWGKDPTPTPGE